MDTRNDRRNGRQRCTDETSIQSISGAVDRFRLQGNHAAFNSQLVSYPR